LLKGWLVAAVAALGIVATAQVDPSRIVAKVNGEEIKGSEYYHRMEYLPGVGRFIGSRYAEMPPGFMTLDTLITERLVMQLAKQKGVVPTQPEIEAELQSRTTENPNYLKDLIDGGLTREDVLNQIKLDLCQFKIVTYGITITDQELEDHYKQNPAKYSIPKRLKLRVIAVSTDALKTQAEAALKAGKSFAEVAKTYSQDASKTIGGDLGLVPSYVLPDDTKKLFEGVKIGQSTPWGKQGEAFVKYLYEDVKPEEKIPLDVNLRRSIRRELMLVKGGIKNNLKDEMKALRRNAKIDITEKDFADAYKKFMDQYLGGS